MIRKKGKKLFSLLLCLTVMVSMMASMTFTVSAAPETVIYAQDFGTDTTVPTGWTLANNVSVKSITDATTPAPTGYPESVCESALNAKASGAGNRPAIVTIDPNTIIPNWVQDFEVFEFDFYMNGGVNVAHIFSMGYNQENSYTNLSNTFFALGNGDGVGARSTLRYYDYNESKWVTIPNCNNTWLKIKVYVDFIGKKMSFTVKNISGELIENYGPFSFSSTGATGFNKIIMSGFRSNGGAVDLNTWVDNFKISSMATNTATFNVKNAANANVEGAVITIKDSTSTYEYGKITTDENGLASIDLPSGQYTYTIDKFASYLPIIDPVEFSIGSENISIPVSLQEQTESSEATSIVISGGQATLTKDINETATTAFTAVVYDQFDAPMDGEEVEWSITPSIEGVSIANGVVTIEPNVPAGEITIKATVKNKPDVFATTTFTLINTTDITIKYYLSDGTSFKEDSIVEDLVIGSTYNLTPAQLAGKLVGTTAYAFDPNNDNNTTKTGAYTVQANGIINVYFAPLSGTYYVYETFENGFTGTWGFARDADASGTVSLSTDTTEGNSYINAAIADTSIPYGYIVKSFEAPVTEQSIIKLVFDFNPMVEKTKGRDSNITVTDANGNVIFSINQHGQNGLKYTIGNNEAVSFGNQNDLNVWYTVEAEIDFNIKLMNLTIKTKDTNTSKVNVTKASFGATEATNLAIFKVGGGYSAAPVYLDNFAISQGSPIRPDPIHQVTITDKAVTDNTITATFNNVSDLAIGNAVAIVALYDSQGVLVDVQSKAITNLAAGANTGAMEFTFSNLSGASTYKIFCWNNLDDMIPLAADTVATNLQ